MPAAKRIYAFTVPTSRGWRGAAARLEEWFENAWNSLRGEPCPGYVHDLDLIEDRLASAGFRLRHRDRQGRWHIAICPDGHGSGRRFRHQNGPEGDVYATR
jgi:hypothetical protein